MTRILLELTIMMKDEFRKISSETLLIHFNKLGYESKVLGRRQWTIFTEKETRLKWQKYKDKEDCNNFYFNNIVTFKVRIIKQVIK